MVRLEAVRDFFRIMYESKALSYQEYQRIDSKLLPHETVHSLAEVLTDIALYKRAKERD